MIIKFFLRKIDSIVSIYCTYWNHLYLYIVYIVIYVLINKKNIIEFKKKKYQNIKNCLKLNDVTELNS